MSEDKKPNNPSVFPDPMRGAEVSETNERPWQLETGITLRDCFANTAMLGVIRKYNGTAQKVYDFDFDDEQAIANYSYKLADAMLKQREL